MPALSRLPKRLARVLLAVAACTALAQPAAAQQPLQPLTFAPGVGTVPSTALVEMVTREQGLWQKQGLQPTTPPPLGGGTAAPGTPKKKTIPTSACTAWARPSTT